jgi:hypothetical protein
MYIIDLFNNYLLSISAEPGTGDTMVCMYVHVCVCGGVMVKEKIENDVITNIC